jgi:hypothetical protein
MHCQMLLKWQLFLKWRLTLTLLLKWPLPLTLNPLLPSRRDGLKGGSEAQMSEPQASFCASRLLSHCVGNPRSGRRERGRLSLLTCFGEAKKVSGCRAAPGYYDRRKNSIGPPKREKKNHSHLTPISMQQKLQKRLRRRTQRLIQMPQHPHLHMRHRIQDRSRLDPFPFQ